MKSLWKFFSFPFHSSTKENSGFSSSFLWGKSEDKNYLILFFLSLSLLIISNNMFMVIYRQITKMRADHFGGFSLNKFSYYLRFHTFYLIIFLLWFSVFHKRKLWLTQACMRKIILIKFYMLIAWRRRNIVTLIGNTKS